jgi:hypothetical protein
MELLKYIMYTVEYKIYILYFNNFIFIKMNNLCNKIELLKYIIYNVYYRIYNIIYFNNSILSRSTIYVILARHKGLPEDDVLTSKHVVANHMYLCVIKVFNTVQ